MSQQDPLANFLGDLAEKIKVTKEHKDIMEAVHASVLATKIVEKQEDPFAGFLLKVGKAISEKIPEKEKVKEEKIEEKIVESKPDSTVILGEKIKEAIEKAKETKPVVVEEVNPKPQQVVEEVLDISTNEPVKTLAFKIKEAIEKAKNKALNGVVETNTENDEKKTENEEPEDEQIATYISELEKIKDTGTVQQKEEAITSLKELKEYVDKTVRDYSRKILDLGGGGGTVAVQYANGGTMNGDLNVNGNILSGGRNIADYFGTGGGGGSGDPAVNALVHTNSGFWNEAYTNLVTNSAAYLLSGTEVYLGEIPALTGNWNSTYTTVNTYSGAWSTGLQNLAFDNNNYDLSITSGNTVNLGILKDDLSEIAATSAYWADTRNDVTFEKNVTIQGNLTALGSSTFKNTIFTTTSALSVINTGPGPALYIFQAAGPYDVASFYDGDGVEVLHVGNAQGGGNPLGKVGINTSYPDVELTVNGQISANNTILAPGCLIGLTTPDPLSPSNVLQAASLTIAGQDLTGGGQIPSTVIRGGVFLGKSDGSIGMLTNTNNAWGPSVFEFAGVNYNVSQYNNIYFTAGYYPQLWLDTSGNVGIQTAYPTERLTVNGNISSSGAIYALDGNSNQWNDAYTNLISNSSTYLGTTRQYDYVQVGQNSYSYCGYAIPNTLTSDAGWTVKRLYFSTAGSLVSSGAVTNAIWNNRYSYNY